MTGRVQEAKEAYFYDNHKRFAGPFEEWKARREAEVHIEEATGWILTLTLIGGSHR